ncbi:Hypothetical predicted protein [Cloeon dipterum]|uniref:Uncharacterized protein n=1 Tax=Cloeon dipterum TaxID=197152 RepID=A0A8S1DVP5_9INSE|nr:Hypothetical predicted protein [Cloeon dipterum]
MGCHSVVTMRSLCFLLLAVALACIFTVTGWKRFIYWQIIYHLANFSEATQFRGIVPDNYDGHLRVFRQRHRDFVSTFARKLNGRSVSEKCPIFELRSRSEESSRANNRTKNCMSKGKYTRAQQTKMAIMRLMHI